MENIDEVTTTPEIDELVELGAEAIETMNEVQPIEIPDQDTIEMPSETETPKLSKSVCICGTPMTCTKI